VIADIFVTVITDIFVSVIAEIFVTEIAEIFVTEIGNIFVMGSSSVNWRNPLPFLLSADVSSYLDVSNNPLIITYLSSYI